MTDSADEPSTRSAPSLAMDWKAYSKQRFASFLVSTRRGFTFIRQSRGPSWLKSLFPTVPTLVSVAFGFGLKAWWDESQAKQLQHTEAQRAIRSVNHELQYDLDLCSLNMQLIDKDIVAADSNSEMPLPASEFAMGVEQSVFLRGVFESVSTEASDKIATVYIAIDSLNHRIQQREFYRHTNKPITTADTPRYHLMRKIIDTDLRERLIDIRTAMTLLQEDLRRLRDPVGTDKG